MKKTKITILHITAIIIFAVLPVISQFLSPQKNSETPQSLVYPVQTYYLFTVSLIYYISSVFRRNLAKTSFIQKHINYGITLKCFGLILTFSLVSEYISTFILKNPSVSYIAPDTPLLYLNLVTGTACAAFWEEAFYRSYLPEALFYLTDNKKRTACEAAACLLFTLGHIYLGVFGVINAAFASVVLRYCAVKTGSIMYSFAVHLAFNSIMLLIVLL